MLNAIYQDLIAAPLTFDFTSGCPSTIPDLEFCSLLEASASYSSSDLNSTCEGVCEASYDTCEAGIDACKVACCYGCFWGKTCGCPNCGGEESSCDSGCDDVASGSTEIEVKNVTGLQNLVFTSASVPSVESGDSLAETVTIVVSPGVIANVYWSLCQSGICVQDTSPMDSSEVEISAQGVITAVACAGGGSALYLNINQLDVEKAGVWDIQGFVNEVLAGVQGSLDWLADNISDLFTTDLYGEYQTLLNDTMEILENEINDVLATTPIIPCP